jgi:signal transduction histidine kinase
MRIAAPLSIVFSLAFSISLHAQSACTDINNVDFVKFINKNISSAYIKKSDTLESVYPSLQFTPGLIHTGTIPNKYVTRKAILKFTLCNSGDNTEGLWFFPGFYFSDIELYRLDHNQPVKLPRILPADPDSIGYRYISLPAGDTATFMAELSFIKTYIITINPRLIQPVYLKAYISEQHHEFYIKDMASYIFCGLFFMLVLFSLAGFSQVSNPEFLYYSGYALFVSLLLFTKAVLGHHATRTGYFIESYLDFILQGLSIIFYILFIQKFLETKKRHRFIFHFYRAGIIMMILSMIGYSIVHFFTDNFTLENGIENTTKFLLLAMILVFLVYSLIHWKVRLLRYLFWGNLCLFLFSTLSQSLILLKHLFSHLPGIFTSALFYYEVGLFLELTFFMMALNYKNKKRIIDETLQLEQLKSENQKKEFEKELAVLKAQQEVRERISSDMHDELGAGMTAIRLMSEILKNRMKNNTPVEIEKISHSANDLLSKMNGIVWSMNSENDRLDDLVSYLRAYALEYLDGTPIHCTVNTPDTVPDMKMESEKRRNIFLCVKETLTNALKHSQASELKIEITINHVLRIKMQDNGKGIELDNLKKFGNGLKNIARRMESIGGSFTIENNRGTVSILLLPL